MNRKGLTLTELLLAAGILVFALSGLLMFFINCHILNAANRNLTVAISHAQYVLESVKNAGTIATIKNNINNNSWNYNAAGINNLGLQALPGESITTCCCTSPCTGANPCVATCDPNANPVGVYLRVNWTERNTRARSTELRTLFTN